MWSDDLRIETPEQIDVSLEVAGLGSRFVAKLVDWLIKWGIVGVVALLALMMALMLGFTPGGSALGYFLAALAAVVFYAFLLGFDIFFEVRSNGQTPGKHLAGIRVLRESGGPVDFRSAGIRNLLGAADFLPFLYLLGAFLILVTRRAQRLGDLAAGTIVVRERGQAVPQEIEPLIQELAGVEFVFTPAQLAGCAPTDRQVLRSFFQRESEMSSKARGKLARRLGRLFLLKTGYPLTPEELEAAGPELFLAALYRDLTQWKAHGG